MKTFIFENKEELYTTASLKLTKEKFQTLGLATGNTMKPLYKKIRCLKNLKWQEKILFLLDEYYPLPKEHPASFSSFIHDHLLQGIEYKIFFPWDSMDQNYKTICIDFEANIKKYGGIDIQLLGLGQNGHIAFNEPGSDKRSRARKVILSPSTKEANAKNFKSDMPVEALSLGVENILESKKIYLLGFRI